MATTQTYRNETGAAARAAQVVPDLVYLLLIPVSVVLAIPPIADSGNHRLLWLGALSILLAAVSSGGLALNSRPTRLVQDREAFVHEAREGDWTTAVWRVPARAHGKGEYPLVQAFARCPGEDWSHVGVDLTITPDATVVVGITLPVDPDQVAQREREYMLVIA